MTPAAVAREAFIAACLEAGMPLVMAPPAREPQGDTVKAAHTA
jgi:hypothetical protein